MAHVSKAPPRTPLAFEAVSVNPPKSKFFPDLEPEPLKDPKRPEPVEAPASADVSLAKSQKPAPTQTDDGEPIW